MASQWETWCQYYYRRPVEGLRLSRERDAPGGLSVDCISDNADSCIRSAAGKASPSRRAVSALRIQGIGLNRREAAAYGDSISCRPPARALPRGSSGLRSLRGRSVCHSRGSTAAPKWARPRASGREIAIGGQGIHGHPPRAVSTTVSHQRSLLPLAQGSGRIDRRPLGGRLLAQPAPCR